MLFNSFLFVGCFLPVVVVVHQLLAGRSLTAAARGWLLLASLVFYGWGSPQHLPLLVVSVLANWLIARAIGRTEDTKRKRWVALGIGANVAFLGVFKYSAFVLSLVGLPPSGLGAHLPLPLGISFFTLQQIMLLMDVYERLSLPPRLFDHASFVMFFPTLSMGPITRAKQLMPLQQQSNAASAEQMARGLSLFAMGLAKKVVLADSFGRIATPGFAEPASASCVEAWLSSLAYTFQIYFDFSGYSDMAMGAALMLALEIPQNFDRPYVSKTVAEFWQRWHITLSVFITTYLFTPILRSMGRATLRTSAVATLAAMGVAGLWHGPAWTFIVFGALHGVALVANQVWKKKSKTRLPAWLAWLLTMVFVNVTFVFFRSRSVADALLLLRAMFIPVHLRGFATFQRHLWLTDVLMIAVPLMVGPFVAFKGKTAVAVAKELRPTRMAALAVVLLLCAALLFMNSTASQEFIYFVF